MWKFELTEWQNKSMQIVMEMKRGGKTFSYVNWKRQNTALRELCCVVLMCVYKKLPMMIIMH